MTSVSAGSGLITTPNGQPSVVDGVDPGNHSGAHSHVLAVDYRVDDVERTWALIKDSHSPLVGIGAHHVVLYTSACDPGRVLVTIGIHHDAPITDLLRSPALFEWFDRAGVNDIPAVFAGSVREKIDLVEPVDHIASGVIVGAIGHVGDVAGLMGNVHARLGRFRDSGVRRVWVYDALDDQREVLTLLEVDNGVNARRWVDRPDAAAEWMSDVGLGGYPRPFVGEVAYVMSVGDGGAGRVTDADTDGQG